MKAIFIAGIPRSGTTLLADMIGAGADGTVTPESQFLDPIISYNSKNSNLTSLELNQISKYLKKSETFSRWEISHEIPEVKDVQTLVSYFIKSFEEKNFKKFSDLWIDHTPSNASRYSNLKNICYKNNFILIYRDPRAIYASIKNLDWGPNNEIDFVPWWLSRFSYLSLVKNFDNVNIIKFEELILRPREILKNLQISSSLLHSLNVEKALDGGSFKVPNYTKNQHKLVGNKLDIQVLSNWKNFLSSSEKKYIEYYLKDFLVYLDYPITYKNNKKSFHDNHKLRRNIFFQRIFNKVRKKIRNFR